MDMPVYYIAVKSTDELLPGRGSNIYSSGLADRDKGNVKFGPASSDEPTLLLAENLTNSDGNTIPPGYYTVSLSAERDLMYLSQSGNFIASFPVIKVEEINPKPSPLIMDSKTLKKEQKKLKKAEKKKKRKLAKKERDYMRIHPGEPLPLDIDEEKIYNEASIEYDTRNDYYLINYERGNIKAVGVLKINY